MPPVAYTAAARNTPSTRSITVSEANEAPGTCWPIHSNTRATAR